MRFTFRTHLIYLDAVVLTMPGEEPILRKNILVVLGVAEDNNTKMCCEEIRYEVVDWIRLLEDIDK